MRRSGLIAAALLAGAGPGLAMPAPAAALQAAQTRPDVDALFEAAARGELRPIERALAGPLPADSAALLRAARGAARYESIAAEGPALARLAAGRDPALRRAALSVMTQAAFARGDYAESARAGRLHPYHRYNR